MVLELQNRNQFTRTAGLHPVPSYSRIVVLTMFTTGMGANSDQQDSAVIGSSGVIHRIEVHAHPVNAGARMDAVVYFGVNRQSEATDDGPVDFRQGVIKNYGGSDNALIIQSADDYFDLRMGVRFVGDKTKLGAIARSSSNFGIRFQVIFQISEG